MILWILAGLLVLAVAFWCGERVGYTSGFWSGYEEGYGARWGRVSEGDK
jgi:hypothetical protein